MSCRSGAIGSLAAHGGDHVEGAGADAHGTIMAYNAGEARAWPALSGDNREMARWYLNRIDLSGLLALLHRVETDADVFRRLAMLWNDGRLPPELVPRFADEAAKLGQVTTHDLIWNSVRQLPAACLKGLCRLLAPIFQARPCHC
jgi:hypothetical protein